MESYTAKHLARNKETVLSDICLKARRDKPFRTSPMRAIIVPTTELNFSPKLEQGGVKTMGSKESGWVTSCDTEELLSVMTVVLMLSW